MSISSLKMYRILQLKRLLKMMQASERMSRFLIIFIVLASGLAVFAQESKVIQFSGMVYSLNNEVREPLSFVNVGILRTRRAVYTNDQGFFSMPVLPGDSLRFQYLGYKILYLQIPPDLSEDRYFREITLEPDTFQLQKATVYSIPSREHFKLEFLEMEVKKDLETIASENLSKDVLERIAPGIPSDGRSAISLYFAQQAQNAVYEGQFKPQQIFSPLAWVKFIEALKRGDFKNKKKPPK